MWGKLSDDKKNKNFIVDLTKQVKKDPEWGKRWKDHILLYARDIGNPSGNDLFFPVFRHKDWYTGLSLERDDKKTNFLDCYHALWMLGNQFEIDSMKDAAVILLVTELKSINTYSPQNNIDWEKYHHDTPQILIDDKVKWGIVTVALILLILLIVMN